MSTTIKLTSAIGGHKAGDTINVTPKTAEYLTTRGHVEQLKPRAKKTDDTKGPEPKPKTDGGGSSSTDPQDRRG